jgi:hypothetical protein
MAALLFTKTKKSTTSEIRRPEFSVFAPAFLLLFALIEYAFDGGAGCRPGDYRKGACLPMACYS